MVRLKPDATLRPNRHRTCPVKATMGLLSSFGRDLRFAVRQLRQTPIVSGVALLSLALGIGANVAIFSLINALMLKALPVHEPERLVLLGFESARGGNTSFTNPQWEFLRDQQEVFTGLTVTGGARFNLNAGASRGRWPGCSSTAGTSTRLASPPSSAEVSRETMTGVVAGRTVQWRSSATASGSGSLAATPPWSVARLRSTATPSR